MSIRYINIGGSNVEIEDNNARSNIGTLYNLSTTNKNNLVNAINENVGRLDNVENNVNNVQTALGEIIKTKLSDGVTLDVGANTSSSFNVPLAISGYTLVGIITFNITGKNSSNCFVQGVTINASSTGATIRFKNSSNSNVSWTATAKGLFIRNDLV